MQVVKSMWEYIREHNLQNPQDKREVLLDAPLKRIFGVNTFTIFSMNKHLSDVLTAAPTEQS
jgi:upstream activation factor subunit UAF30